MGASENELKDLLEEINYYLPEFQCDLSDLKILKSEFVINYFRSVLAIFGRHESKSLVDKGVEQTSHILPVVKLFREVKTIFPDNMALIQNMSIDVLLDPKPSDIQYIIATINLCRFAFKRLCAFTKSEKIQKNYDELTTTLEIYKVYEDMKQLKIQHDEDKRTRESRISEAIQDIGKLNEAVGSIGSKLKEQEAIGKDLEKKKEILCRRTKKIQKAIGVEEEKSKIIATKMDLQTKYEDLRKEVEDLRKEEEENKKSTKVLKAAKCQLAGIEKKLGTIMSDCKDVENRELRIRTTETEQAQKCTKITCLREQLQLRQAAKEDFRSQLVDLEEKIKNLERRGDGIPTLRPKMLEMELKRSKLVDRLPILEDTFFKSFEDFKKEKQCVTDMCRQLIEDIH